MFYIVVVTKPRYNRKPAIKTDC